MLPTIEISRQFGGLFAPILLYKIGGRQTTSQMPDLAEGLFCDEPKPQRLYHGDHSNTLMTPYKNFDRQPGPCGLYCLQVDKEMTMTAKKIWVVCWVAADGHGQLLMFGSRDEAAAVRAFKREFKFRTVTEVYRLAGSFQF